MLVLGMNVVVLLSFRHINYTTDLTVFSVIGYLRGSPGMVMVLPQNVTNRAPRNKTNVL